MDIQNLTDEKIEEIVKKIVEKSMGEELKREKEEKQLAFNLLEKVFLHKKSKADKMLYKRLKYMYKEILLKY